MNTVTVEMPDDVREMIDEARGEQDVATFLLAAGKRAAKRRLTRHMLDSDTDELTLADHIRMADEAAVNQIPLAESRQRVLVILEAEAAEAAKR